MLAQPPAILQPTAKWLPRAPPLRERSAAELRVEKLHWVLGQEHTRVREQRDGLAAQRDLILRLAGDLILLRAKSYARELLLRCLVGWFVLQSPTAQAARLLSAEAQAARLAALDSPLAQRVSAGGMPLTGVPQWPQVSKLVVATLERLEAPSSGSPTDA